MLFSVVIPTFNRETFLKAAIDSVLAQEFQDYELIVVDEGSTDGTRAMLEQFRDRVSIIAGPQTGPAAARNLGAKHARGRYIAFLDSDDLWLPWTLSVHAEALQSSGFPKVLVGAFREFEQAFETAQIGRSAMAVQKYTDYLQGVCAGVVFGANVATIERQHFVESGGFDESMGVFEDLDLGLRIGLVSPFLAIRNPITIAYRRHPGNFTLNAGSSAAGIRRIIKKEKAGTYPGGHSRAAERRQIITRSARSACVHCTRTHRLLDALRIYVDTFPWHVAATRMKFLLGIPVLLFGAAFRRAITRS